MCIRDRLRDVACARAGDRRWVDGLGLFRGPVLAVEAGHGFGASMEASLARFAHSRSVDRLVFPERSHLDVLLARDEEATVAAPVHAWLVREVFPRR